MHLRVCIHVCVQIIISNCVSIVPCQVRQQMEEQVAQKSSELEQYLQRVRELEDMYHRLEDALEEERGARQDEETVRRLQARSVLQTQKSRHILMHS